jgi:hypothetical protein
MAATPATMLRFVTQGLQDKSRLNSPRGQPSVNFYRAVVRRRTRWASQWRRVEFDNLADFGRMATVTLPIIGELITRATLVVELPDLYTPQVRAQTLAGFSPVIGPRWSWTNAIGHALCSEVEFTIGGQVVDRVDSRLMEVLDETTTPVEHLDAYNIMIARNPTNYSQDDYKGGKPTQQRLQSVEIAVPFWWNRGPGPQALPIQALAKDKVQINVTFRPVQECVYTDARVNPLNPGAEATQAGPMPIMSGCGFYKRSGDPGSQPIYDMTRVGLGVPPSFTPNGIVLSGHTMPTEWHFRDAYWIIEYVSLEDREAAAFRNADLQIPIEQHIAIPVTQTNGAREVRIPIAQGGLVRDIQWVAQRAEATDYNAYFLFSRDLGPAGAKGSFIPWWPDAVIPDWDYGDGYVRPAFADRLSEPITAATLWARGLRRFEHEGMSIFRSLAPALGCRRTPIIDRYIYRYDFGFWPTGGLVDALDRKTDEVRGFSNWDLLQNKELVLTLDTEACDYYAPAVVYGETQEFIVGDLHPITLPAATFDLLQFELRGGLLGGIVNGTISLTQLQQAFGAGFQLFARLVPNVPAGGSAALILKTSGGTYHWLAVAAGGGAGVPTIGDPTRTYTGGAASSATDIGFRGDDQQTHAATPVYGGAGGAGVVGQPDGTQMVTAAAFVEMLTATGGTTNTYAGGDGYTGGGSGSESGGGGGSYVSSYVSDLYSIPGDKTLRPQGNRVAVTPFRRNTSGRRNFDIYAWLTTYNILRITRGRGALMFSAG